MRGKGFFVSVILTSFSTTAFATMSAPNGWYLEPNVGYSNVTNKNYPGITSSSHFGYNINLGYKFFPYFATEFGYTRYGENTIKDFTGTKAAVDRFYSFDIAGKAIVPFGVTGIEAFGKLGAARVASRVTIKNALSAATLGMPSNNNSTTGVYVGAGLQYNFTPYLAMNTQWARACGNSSTGTLDLISLGISYLSD